MFVELALFMNAMKKKQLQPTAEEISNLVSAQCDGASVPKVAVELVQKWMEGNAMPDEGHKDALRKAALALASP